MSQYNHVAETIAAEACSEGQADMHAVANVIANRVKATEFPNTPYLVVSQPGQFLGFKNKNKKEIYKGCKEYADFLSKNILSLPDKTKGALYFKKFGHMGHIYYKKTPS